MSYTSRITTSWVLMPGTIFRNAKLFGLVFMDCDFVRVKYEMFFCRKVGGQLAAKLVVAVIYL